MGLGTWWSFDTSGNAIFSFTNTQTCFRQLISHVAGPGSNSIDWRYPRRSSGRSHWAPSRILTAVMDGLGDNGLQGQSEGAIASAKESREAQSDDTQIHHFLQFLGLLL